MRRWIFLPLLFCSALAFSQNQQSSPPKSNEAAQKVLPTAEKETGDPKTSSDNTVNDNMTMTEKKSTGGNQIIKIIYASSSWNKNDATIDTAFLYVRNSTDKKVIKILLEETGPSTATFSGIFSLDFAEDEKFRPEVFIPPQAIRAAPGSTEKFYTMLRKGQLKKKPLVFRKDKDGRQLVDVYDTLEQAERAKEVHEQDIKEQRKQGTAGTDTEITQSQLNSAANQRELERIRLEQLERQKVELREAEAKKRSGEEQKRRKAEAIALAEQGMDHFKKDEFGLAEEKFKEALEMDPLEKSFMYSYAVSLYRNGKYNEALVAFKLSPEDPSLALEKKYYFGLCHYQLKEYEQDLPYFQELKNSGDETYGALGAFYEGLTFFAQEKLEDSKTSFEFVLDNSKDPQLDKQAETYIETILAMMQIRELAKKKWFLNGTLGAMYDSNVLLSPDNVTSQGTATDKDSPRAMMSASAKYRWHYSEKNEFGTQISTYYLYSINDDVAAADVFLMNFSAPWTKKGKWSQSGYNFTLKPAYELTLIDVYSTGQKPFMPIIMASPLVAVDYMLLQSPKKFAIFGAEVRMDDSRLADTAPVSETNYDSMKYTLKGNQTFLLNDSRKKSLTAGLAYIFNNAKGTNRRYNRYQINSTFITPISDSELMNAALTLYQLDYYKSSDNRKDFNLNLGLGYQKTLSQMWSWALNAGYTDNTSNVNANDYSQFT
ncbi:MAG: hypothetical protein KDD22_07855, partial [Bdellovibrionales bacterium]|nr:hypothetical protein [Bdellovibrionales bacterium]